MVLNCIFWKTKEKEGISVAGKKAVYFINTNREYGYVAYLVWDILKEEGYLAEEAGFDFDGQKVMRYQDEAGNWFYFAPTHRAICLDYEKCLPEMNEHFADFDISGMVTWHEGANALEHVLTVHSLGDLPSGVYGGAKPRLMRNLMHAIEKNRKDLGLEEFRVVTEATHWSGVYHDVGDPTLLTKFPVPMMDIEVGSEPESWNNKEAARALARSLTKIFDDDGKRVHNLLCVGGVHFEPNFAEAVFTEWGENQAFGVSHIMANQWLVSGQYENETGVERASHCIDAIEGGIEAIFFHDKMKACYKDLVRALGEKYGVPIYKHQKLRHPEELEWKE